MNYQCWMAFPCSWLTGWETEAQSHEAQSDQEVKGTSQELLVYWAENSASG